MPKAVCGHLNGTLFGDDGKEILRGTIEKTPDCEGFLLPGWTTPGMAFELALTRLAQLNGVKSLPEGFEQGLRVEVAINLSLPEAAAAATDAAQSVTDSIELSPDIAEGLRNKDICPGCGAKTEKDGVGARCPQCGWTVIT